MYKKNYFLISFFTVLSIFSLVKLYDNAINLDTFEYGEWLINYQHGFVRRGIIGELIYLLSYLLNNNLQLSFFIFLSLISLTYYYLNYLLLKKIEFNFIFYFLIFSPLFYVFFIIISKVGIRKEIILYTFYILYLLSLTFKNYKFKKNWKFIFIFPILLLNHEGIFFYLPYLILPLLFIAKKDDLKLVLSQILVLIIFSTLVMILLYFNKGTNEHVLNICQSLGNYTPSKCEWWGPVAALNKDLLVNLDNKPLNFFYLSASYKTWLGFLFYIFFSFLPLIFFLKLVKIKKKDFIIKKLFIYLFFILVFISTLPLFHIAEDWSRWFSIHFHLSVYFLIFLYYMNLITLKKDLLFNKINSYLMRKKIILIFFLFLYSTFFHHSHFFFKDVKLEITYYKIYNKIIEKF